RNITTPFINRLANYLSLGTCLVIEQNNECVYLDCIDNPNSPTLQRIGKRAPLHATGSGKVLLSKYSELQLGEYISVKGLTRYTDHTITDPDLLRSELERIRRQDFAIDEEECEVGLRCISIPLRNYTGEIIAAMSVFGNTCDLTDQRIHDEIYPMLKEATDTISSRLGYTPNLNPS
ncbi:MAG: IclR family transcriptional regulator, partial [Bacillota bacterium]